MSPDHAAVSQLDTNPPNSSENERVSERVPVARPRFLVPTDLPPSALALGLTEAQLAVLGQLLHGLSNRDIGLALQRSIKTIEHHVSQILRRAGVKSRAALVAKLSDTQEPANHLEEARQASS